jgi:hypothetical protein
MSKSMIAVASSFACVVLGCAGAPEPPADVLEAMAAQNRAQAAGSAAPAASAAAATPATPAAAAACTFAGAWVAPIRGAGAAGQSITWTINADGTSDSQVGSVGSVKSKWQMSGTTLTMTDVSSTPATMACAADAGGHYSVIFAPDCKTLTLAAQGDECGPRKAGLDQSAFRRQ